MKSQKKAVIFSLLTILWTAVIFSFSLQPAEASASLSGGLLQRLLDWFYWCTGLQIPTSFAHFMIRKIAHFSEFFLLGILGYQACKNWLGKWWPALCYGAVIAVMDEHIQYFTASGRAMLVTDMILDTAGVATAIVLTLLFAEIAAKRKNKNTKNKESVA